MKTISSFKFFRPNLISKILFWLYLIAIFYIYGISIKILIIFFFNYSKYSTSQYFQFLLMHLFYFLQFSIFCFFQYKTQILLELEIQNSPQITDSARIFSKHIGIPILISFFFIFICCFRIQGKL